MLWPPARAAFAWVHRAAHVLGEVDSSGITVRAQLAGLLGAKTRHRAVAGSLAGGVDHFVKVTRSYWPGLFACYDQPGLPRTNNDLEQAFGSHRYHERRATGRKRASPALVLRGSARLVAGLATRTREFVAADLAGADPAAWRAELEERRQRRVDRRRFRQDPEVTLKDLENKLNPSGLPAWFFPDLAVNSELADRLAQPAVLGGQVGRGRVTGGEGDQGEPVFLFAENLDVDAKPSGGLGNAKIDGLASELVDVGLQSCGRGSHGTTPRRAS